MGLIRERLACVPSSSQPPVPTLSRYNVPLVRVPLLGPGHPWETNPLKCDKISTASSANGAVPEVERFA